MGNLSISGSARPRALALSFLVAVTAMAGVAFTPTATAATTTYNFDSGTQGWTTLGSPNDWQHGSSSLYAAHSGSSMWGTVLNGQYSLGSRSHLISPTFTVDPAGGDLKWWAIDDYGNSENDEAQVHISTDNGVSWTTIWTSGSLGHQTFWSQWSVSLSAYAGLPVQVKFYFHETSNGHTHTGWYVDDVIVPGTAGGTPQPPANAFYDFETGAQGWTSTGVVNDWQWGSSTLHGAHSGSNMWGTILNGDYRLGSTSYLVSPPFTVDPAGGVMSWWSIDDYGSTQLDEAQVHVSTDGGATWTSVYSSPMWHMTSWRSNSISLAAYAAQVVQVRFAFVETSNDHTHTGWYIDDVSLPVGTVADLDGDGVPDGSDNCPGIANANQADSDNDGIGDACDVNVDADGDGVQDQNDNCPATWNPTQADADNNGIGDACEPSLDTDADGVQDTADNCPATYNPTQADADNDGIGDACDSNVDLDNDGVPDPLESAICSRALTQQLLTSLGGSAGTCSGPAAYNPPVNSTTLRVPTSTSNGPDTDNDGFVDYIDVHYTRYTITRHPPSARADADGSQRQTIDTAPSNPNVPVIAAFCTPLPLPSGVVSNGDADQDGFPASVTVTQSNLCVDRRLPGTATIDPAGSFTTVGVDTNDNNPDTPVQSRYESPWIPVNATFSQDVDDDTIPGYKYVGYTKLTFDRRFPTQATWSSKVETTKLDPNDNDRTNPIVVLGLDADKDLIFDNAEPFLCLVEDQTTDLDGRCSGPSNYQPPSLMQAIVSDAFSRT